MNFYLEAAVIPLDLLLCVYLRIKYRDKGAVNRAFRHFAYAVLISTVLDVLFAANFNLHAQRPAIYYLTVDMITHAAAFLTTIIFLLYVIAYLNNEEAGRNLNLIIRAVMASYLFFWVLNYFTGTIVIYDEYGYYSEGVMFSAVVFIAPVAVLLGGVVLMLFHREKYERWQWTALFVSFALSGFVFAVQILFYRNLLVIFFIAALCLYVMFFCLETPMYQQLAGHMDGLEEAQVEARRALGQAEEENRRKSEFLENMSREISVPMGSILHLGERILKESMDAEVRRCAVQIDNAGHHLMTMIGDILDLSQMENGKLKLEPVRYHLGRVLMEAETATSTRAQAKGILFDTHYAPTLPDELYGDEKRLAQIIECLLDNAVKYTSAGNVQLSVAGKRHYDKMHLHIDVTDTGTGIREDALPHLYDPFYRAGSETDKEDRGAGLTLAITKMLVELMGGTIDVMSSVGKGTTFHVVLPQEVRGDRTVSDYMKEKMI